MDHKYSLKISFISDRELNDNEILLALKGQLDLFLKFSKIDEQLPNFTTHDFIIKKDLEEAAGRL
jgi:hypothetical protein